MLEEFIGKVPFLSLRGTYDNPLEALRDYYETKVEVYFVGICATEEGAIGGMDFCRMLSLPTRVIFVAETGGYAAECFRLDALDYLTGDFDFSVFSNRSARLPVGSACRRRPHNPTRRSLLRVRVRPAKSISGPTAALSVLN